MAEREAFTNPLGQADLNRPPSGIGGSPDLSSPLWPGSPHTSLGVKPFPVSPPPWIGELCPPGRAVQLGPLWCQTPLYPSLPFPSSVQPSSSLPMGSTGFGPQVTPQPGALVKGTDHTAISHGPEALAVALSRLCL